MESCSKCFLPFQPDVMEGNVFDGRLDHIRLDPEVGAVVVGFDSHISFNKILKASSYLKNPDVLFIATNRDERFPMEHIVCPGKLAVHLWSCSFVASCQAKSCEYKHKLVVGSKHFQPFMLSSCNLTDISMHRCTYINVRYGFTFWHVVS